MRFIKNIPACVYAVTLFYFVVVSANAQNTNLSVGTEQLKNNAILWLKGNGSSQGLLLPSVSNRSSFTGLNSSDDKGMLVYDLSDNKIYFWNGSAWTEVGPSGGGSNQQLSLNGNTFTLTGAPLSTVSLASGTLTAGQALVWNGSNWVAVALSGDVAGSHDNTQVSGLKGKALPAALPTTTQALVYDGTSWAFQTLPAGGGTGDITDVVAGVGLTGGASTGSATLGVDVGTTANKIVQLDATGKLPAVDGSQLTNITISGLGTLASLNTVSTTEITDGTINDGDVSPAAAIAGTKISPSFGTQNISTSGTISTGAATVTGLTVSGSTSIINGVTYNWPAGPVAPGAVLTYVGGPGILSWAPSAANGWSLTGNAGTVAGTSFIGTTDDVALNFRVNNVPAGRLASDGNVFFGYFSGSQNLAVSNVGIGFQSLRTNTTGAQNTAIGAGSLYTNQNGHHNTASGMNALYFNQTGSFNVANGYNALYNNSDGTENTAVGTGSLYNNTAGERNAALGFNSLFYNSTGGNNTATGVFALFDNTTGSFNTASGHQALYSNGFGSSNTAIGKDALMLNTVGSENAATGRDALGSNDGGSRNTASGYRALFSNVSGSNGTAFGYGAMLYANNNLSDFQNTNTAVGSEALRGSPFPSSNTGARNTSTGYQSLFSNTTGSDNTVTGYMALNANTFGNYNTANGSTALVANTNGQNNSAFGFEAMYFSQTGSDNTATGYGALRSNISGNVNTASGLNALFKNVGGTGNTAIGVYTLQTNVQGTNNTAIGYLADVADGNLNNATAIGFGAIVNTSDKIVLGNASATTVGGYGDFTNYSDRRLKENIVYKNDLGLNFISRLRPATYNYIKDINRRSRDGLIAQDVQQILDELNIEFSGLVVDKDADKTLNLSYADFVIPLITAVQQQQTMIDTLALNKNRLDAENIRLQNKISALEKKQDQEILSLRREIDEVKKLLGLEAMRGDKKN